MKNCRAFVDVEPESSEGLRCTEPAGPMGFCFVHEAARRNPLRRMPVSTSRSEWERNHRDEDT